MTPPVRLVVRFDGHVPHQLVELVVVPEQDNAFRRGFSAEHEMLGVAVEHLELAKGRSGVGGDDHMPGVS